MARRSTSRRQRLPGSAGSSFSCPPSNQEPGSSSSISKRKNNLEHHVDREQKNARIEKSRNQTDDLHLLQPADITSSIQTIESPIQKPEPLDAGFIRTKQATAVGALFWYSHEDDNKISRDFLYHNGLLPQAWNRTIMLSFSLDSKPGKIHQLEFAIEENASFDVSLGTSWSRAAEENDKKSTAMTIREPLDGKSTPLFATQCPSSGLIHSRPESRIFNHDMPPPEYAAEFMHYLWKYRTKEN
jgi:hypothetical protein